MTPEKQMSREVYKSSTMGDIPLSFMGRHLLQSLREAFSDYAVKVAGRGAVPFTAWDPVSLARGRIAKYMSDLEAKNVPPSLNAFSDTQLTMELRARDVARQGAANICGVSYKQEHNYGWAQAPKQSPWAVQRYRYIVEYVGAGPLTSGPIKTHIKLVGSIRTEAVNMDFALDNVLQSCKDAGYNLKREDFQVRLLGPVE
jgi:hypothetical protein